MTVKTAIAEPALLPLLVINTPAGSELTYEPLPTAVTFTVKVQLLFAGTDRPTGKVTVEPPAIATGAPLPGQVVATPDVTAITMPLGRVSTSAAVNVATVALGLLKVMVSVETPPALMLAGPKVLPSMGAAGPSGTTIKVALAGAALLPLLVIRAPALSVLR